MAAWGFLGLLCAFTLAQRVPLGWLLPWFGFLFGLYRALASRKRESAHGPRTAAAPPDQRPAEVEVLTFAPDGALTAESIARDVLRQLHRRAPHLVATLKAEGSCHRIAFPRTSGSQYVFELSVGPISDSEPSCCWSFGPCRKPHMGGRPGSGRGPCAASRSSTTAPGGPIRPWCRSRPSGAGARSGTSRTAPRRRPWLTRARPDVGDQPEWKPAVADIEFLRIPAERRRRTPLLMNRRLAASSQ